MFESLAAKIGLGLLSDKIGKFQIPKWVWILAAGSLLTIGGFIFHHYKVSDFEKTIRADQKKQDDDAHQKELNSAHQDALNWKAQYIVASTKITSQERSDHETVVASNAARAASLLAQGSGKASCRPVSSATSEFSTSGHDQGTGTSVNAGLGGVPNQAGTDIIGVPLNDLLTFAINYDDIRHEVKTWRNDKIQQQNLYDQLLNSDLSGK